ncbi:hypothetical protein [Lactococcus protaetiae]|nr:hypothetical protein [Lactococcus protaetiae]
MLICEQYTTTNGEIVTKWLTKELWEVSKDNFTRRFYQLSDYLRYMTK